MKQEFKKLLLLIPIRVQDDLLPVVESEGWHTVKDLFRKTNTSYNTHWNGNYVLDQDEIPWKASQEEIASLVKSQGRVIVLSDGKYHISDEIAFYTDRDGSVYVLEDDVQGLLE
jgi:hypothetical protein